jgi:hypothetical protein
MELRGACPAANGQCAVLRVQSRFRVRSTCRRQPEAGALTGPMGRAAATQPAGTRPGVPTPFPGLSLAGCLPQNHRVRTCERARDFPPRARSESDTTAK